MKCDKIQELLPLYIDNELDADMAKCVDNHLIDCKICQDDLKALKTILSDIHKSYPEIDVPSDFNDKLHKRLVDSNAANHDAVYKTPNRFNAKNIFRYSSLAACLVLLLLAIDFLPKYNNEYNRYLPRDVGSKNGALVPPQTMNPDSSTIVPNNQAPLIESQKPKVLPTKDGTKDVGEQSGVEAPIVTANQEPVADKGPKEPTATQRANEVATEPKNQDIDTEPNQNDTATVLPPADAEAPPGNSMEQKEAQQAAPKETSVAPASGGAGGAAKMVGFATQGLSKIAVDNTPKVTYTLQITPSTEQKQSITAYVEGIMARTDNMFYGDINAYNETKIYCKNNKIKYSETKKDYGEKYKTLVVEFNKIVDDINKNGSTQEKEDRAMGIKADIDSIISITNTHYVVIN